MNVADAALMILLACSPAGIDCREMAAARSYASIDMCRHDLPAVLRRMNSGSRTVIGRCAPADNPGVDPIVTGAARQPVARVRVTTMGRGVPSSRDYAVPVEPGRPAQPGERSGSLP